MGRRRLPAEWERQSAVQFTFPHSGTDWAGMLDRVTSCFVEIIESASRHEMVLVLCQSIEEVEAAFGDAPRENLRLVEMDSNDTWARDHGGITVFEDGAPVILDFMFNGWGLKFPADKDNLITGILHQMGVFGATPLLKPGLVLEGGGIESDGRGTLLTTAQCLLSPNRNPHLSKAGIEERLKELFGLDRILWLHHGFLAGDDTDSHIDTLARFCDPDTIAYVRCADPADEHHAALLRMEKELLQFRTAAGMPYRLVPLPMPGAIHDEKGQRLPATYANFLILNGAVLVPTYGVPEDGIALELLRPLFPGREVIGVNCRPLLFQHGSLHCVSMQYPEGVVKSDFFPEHSRIHPENFRKRGK